MICLNAGGGVNNTMSFNELAKTQINECFFFFALTVINSKNVPKDVSWFITWQTNFERKEIYANNNLLLTVHNINVCDFSASFEQNHFRKQSSFSTIHPEMQLYLIRNHFSVRNTWYSQ